MKLPGSVAVQLRLTAHPSSVPNSGISERDPLSTLNLTNLPPQHISVSANSGASATPTPGGARTRAAGDTGGVAGSGANSRKPIRVTAPAAKISDRLMERLVYCHVCVEQYIQHHEKPTETTARDTWVTIGGRQVYHRNVIGKQNVSQGALAIFVINACTG